MRERSGRGWLWLLAAGVATVVIWHLPYGRVVLYPFTILATWFHEMSHGLAAMLVGGRFIELRLMPDGSGLARYTMEAGGADRFRQAIVAAAGPMGPPIAGAGLILLSRGRGAGRGPLLLLGAALLISALLWVRGGFGFVLCLLLGGLMLAVGLAARHSVRQFFLQFVGVQACISTFEQIDYLFSPYAGLNAPSDTLQIAQALGLPHWFWGGLLTLASLGLLAVGLVGAYRGRED